MTTTDEANERGNLLAVEDLAVEFAGGEQTIRVVDGVSFSIREGEIVGLVGESGSGKSVTILSILRLVPPPGQIVGGRILFKGRNLLALDSRDLRQVRGSEIVLIPPDATAALNPVARVGDQVIEGIMSHTRQVTSIDARKRALDMFRRVGLPNPEMRYRRYPHELSGGMQQRMLIASALLLSPDLILADEPTTALDVTIQAQILRLLLEVRQEFGAAILLVTHDLAAIAGTCDRVLVMYAGHIVESAPAADLFAQPVHPYTRALMASIPPLDPEPPAVLQTILGVPPDSGAWPPGCRFAPRCELRTSLGNPALCESLDPALLEVGPLRSVACHFAAGEARSATSSRIASRASAGVATDISGPAT